MLLYLILIAFGILIGTLATQMFATKTRNNTRLKEWSADDPLWQHPIHRAVSHIRDDISSIQQLLIVTNGLLAGLIVALVINLIR